MGVMEWLKRKVVMPVGVLPYADHPQRKDALLASYSKNDTSWKDNTATYRNGGPPEAAGAAESSCGVYAIIVLFDSPTSSNKLSPNIDFLSPSIL